MEMNVGLEERTEVSDMTQNGGAPQHILCLEADADGQLNEVSTAGLLPGDGAVGRSGLLEEMESLDDFDAPLVLDAAPDLSLIDEDTASAPPGDADQQPTSSGNLPPAPELVDAPTYAFATVEDHVAALVTDPLEQTRRDLVLAGMSPQIEVAMLIYLAKASSLAGRPMSLQIRGPSEAGKTTVTNMVARLHPPGRLISAMSITFAALMDGAGNGPDLRRWVIHFDEAVEGRKVDGELMAAIRQLTTQEKVTRVKCGKGGGKEITLLGPVTVIDTLLTDTEMSEQDANRFVVVEVKDDQETRDAIAALATEKFQDVGLRRTEVSNQIAEAHQVFLQGLRDDLTVIIPRWDLHGPSVRFTTSVCSLVCAAAWLNQGRRVISENSKTLQATVEDYEQVWQILRDNRVLAPESGFNESSKRILSVWQQQAHKNGNMKLTTSQLRDLSEPNMSPGHFNRLLKRICDAGFAFVVGNAARGEKIYQLTPAGETYSGCDWISRLPTPDSLRQAQDGAAGRNS